MIPPTSDMGEWTEKYATALEDARTNQEERLTAIDKIAAEWAGCMEDEPDPEAEWGHSPGCPLDPPVTHETHPECYESFVDGASIDPAGFKRPDVVYKWDPAEAAKACQCAIGALWKIAQLAKGGK